MSQDKTPGAGVSRRLAPGFWMVESAAPPADAGRLLARGGGLSASGGSAVRGTTVALRDGAQELVGVATVLPGTHSPLAGCRSAASLARTRHLADFTWKEVALSCRARHAPAQPRRLAVPPWA